MNIDNIVRGTAPVKSVTITLNEYEAAVVIGCLKRLGGKPSLYPANRARRTVAAILVRQLTGDEKFAR